MKIEVVSRPSGRINSRLKYDEIYCAFATLGDSQALSVDLPEDKNSESFRVSVIRGLTIRGFVVNSHIKDGKLILYKRLGGAA